MNAPQTLQLLLAKALYADGDAINAGALILHEAIRFHGAGVGFHRDFGSGRQRKSRAYAIE